MGKMLDSTLSWIFEKMAKAYVHRTGNRLSDAKVPVVQEVDGKPYFNLSSIGSADLAKLSGANGIDGTIAEAISGLTSFSDEELVLKEGVSFSDYSSYCRKAGRAVFVFLDVIVPANLKPWDSILEVPASSNSFFAFVDCRGKKLLFLGNEVCWWSTTTTTETRVTASFMFISNS